MDFGADSTPAAELGRQLHQLAALLGGDGLTEPAQESARVVLAQARPPRRTGQLGASLTADASRDGVVFASTARYWTFVHFGAPRRNIRARPFFPEALQATTEQLADIYARHLSDTITHTIT